MTLNVKGYQLRVQEGVIKDIDVDYKHSYSTTTTIIKDSPSSIGTSSTTTNSHTTKFQHFTLQNEAEVKTVTLVNFDLKSQIGNYLRVYFLNNHPIAAVDDTLKLTCYDTGELYEDIKYKRRNIIWLGVPITLISSYYYGFNGFANGIFSFFGIIIINKLWRRLDILEFKSKFKSNFMGYKNRWRLLRRKY